MAANDDDQKPDPKDDDPSLDMSQAAVKRMIAEGRERGFITYDQLNAVLPPEQVSSDQIEDVMSMLSEMDIRVVESDEEADEAEPGGELATTASTSRELTVATTETEKLDRTDDPVRMYLREMGSVELLSREGEIAIAKRIEAGRNTMIAGLCESPLTFKAITMWRQELLDEDILLRDVIDLETTFGRAMDEDGEEEEVLPTETRPAANTAGAPAPRARRRNSTPTATRWAARRTRRTTTARTCRWPPWKPRSSPRCWRRWRPSHGAMKSCRTCRTTACRRR